LAVSGEGGLVDDLGGAVLGGVGGGDHHGAGPDQQVHGADAELFDRSRRAIRLTAAGAALLTEARRLLTDLDRTLRSVQRIGAGAVGRLVVGFVPSAANGRLPRVLRSYRTAYPDVELVMRELGPDALLRGLQDRSLDVALWSISPFLTRPGRDAGGNRTVAARAARRPSCRGRRDGGAGGCRR
jgi:DNA-binding transcriptional LysR family regulator